MKRFGIGLAAVFLASVIAGCDSGIKEGPSNEPATPTGQPPGFREMMEKDAKNMQLKGARPQNAPSGKSESVGSGKSESAPAGKPQP